MRAIAWILVAMGWTTMAAAAESRLDGSKDIYLRLGDAARMTNGWGRAQDGASVTGAALAVGSVGFERGIGMHAPAELVFNAGGKYRWLTFHAGISSEMTENGSVVVAVWLDGKKAHQTPVLRIGGEPIYVCVPVDGAKEVRLVATDAGNGIGADHINYGYLRLSIAADRPAPEKPRPAAGAIAGMEDLSSVMPARGAASTAPAKQWEFAMVSGNGRMGAMVFGHPSAETIVANHCRLFLPLGSREIVPDLAQYLPELRRIIRAQGYGAAMEFYLGKAREQGFPGLTWTDPYHPGFLLKLKMDTKGAVRDYVRTEDFRTGEVMVRYTDDAGTWTRKLFVSRPDNAIILSIRGPGKFDCGLSMDPITHALIDSKITTDADGIACHNVYRKGKGGYDGAVRIVTRGGKTSTDGESIAVAGADEVHVLMRIETWKKAEQSDPAALRTALARLPADYAALFGPHAKAHAALFDRVTLDVGGGEQRTWSSERLLDLAAKEDRLPPALLEKIYDAGRYMFICSAGELPPNLQGIWTGTWTPAWSGDFTTDTNVQLAIALGFSANLTELMEGYYRLIEDAVPEFRENARKYFGARGIVAPTRMSNTGLMLHWGDWPGVFWTAGAGWMIHWHFDHWRYTGDREFLARRTVPLLKEVAAFYEDFMTVDEKTGRYEFIPSYSPESECGITATMDVMVAREVFTNLIEACTVLGIEPESIPKWKAIIEKLPPYRITKDGTIAEFVPEGYREHYAHRHLSHLYAAYQATGELDPQRTPELWKAAQEATRRRINSGGEQSSHGRMHMGLAASYLGMAEEAWGRVVVMATKKSMYPSLITSHEPGQRIFNTDANGTIPEIVNRMLLHSWPGRLDLLPALPEALPKGSIRGMLARGQIHIDRLAWDRPAQSIELELTSSIDQSIALRAPWKQIKARLAGDAGKLTAQDDGWTLSLPAGKKVSVSLGK